MKKGKYWIMIGMVSLLVLLMLTGCGSDTLKSAQNTPQEEIISEEGSGEESTSDGSSEGETVPASEGETAEDGSGVEPTENPDTNCSAINPHPMAEGMAETFDFTYDQIMTWYCDGAAFSDILLALETDLLVEQSPEELLNMLEDSTWEEIWVEFGVEK